MVKAYPSVADLQVDVDGIGDGIDAARYVYEYTGCDYADSSYGRRVLIARNVTP